MFDDEVARTAPSEPGARHEIAEPVVSSPDHGSGAVVRPAVVLEPDLGTAQARASAGAPLAISATPTAEPEPAVDPEVLEIRRLFDVFGEEAAPTPPLEEPGVAGPVQEESLFDGSKAAPAVAAASVLAPSPVAPDSSTGAAPPPDDEDSEAEPNKRRWRRRRKVVSPPPPPPRWRRVAFATAVLALIAGGGALAYLGSETVRESTDGKVINVTDDPSAPGFEAFVTPSPTMLVIHNDGDEVLGYTLLALGPDDQGGAIVFIPTSTLGELEEFGEQPLTLAYAGGGAPVATQVIQDMLGTGIQDVVEIDSPRWTTLTEPLAPFTFDNPDSVILTDPVTGEDGLLFPAGEIQLEAVGVGQYLSEGTEGESELARLARDEVFWTEWLAAIAASDDPGAVPGEVDSGIGRFARGLASGPVTMMTLPVTEFQVPDGPVVFVANEAQIEALITDIIPLPTSPEFGVRPKVRLLNGTTDPDILPPLVTPLVQAGAEITVFGNASTFSESTTQIIFTDPSFSDDARALQEALGVGEIVREERPVENVDITIVIGSDYTGVD